VLKKILQRLQTVTEPFSNHRRSRKENAGFGPHSSRPVTRKIERNEAIPGNTYSIAKSNRQELFNKKIKRLSKGNTISPWPSKPKIVGCPFRFVKGIFFARAATKSAARQGFPEHVDIRITLATSYCTAHVEMK